MPSFKILIINIIWISSIMIVWFIANIILYLIVMLDKWIKLSNASSSNRNLLKWFDAYNQNTKGNCHGSISYRESYAFYALFNVNLWSLWSLNVQSNLIEITIKHLIVLETTHNFECAAYSIPYFEDGCCSNIVVLMGVWKLANSFLARFWIFKIKLCKQTTSSEETTSSTNHHFV